MAYELASIATLALMGFGSTNRVQVRPKADSGGAYLCDERSDGPVDSRVCYQGRFSRTEAESVKVSPVLGGIPGLTPLLLHRLTNGRLRRATVIVSVRCAGRNP